MEEAYIGSIVLFAGNFPPRGWMFCQGQSLSIAQNQALFSILGTTYGGDGQRAFNLPDLRSRVPVGTGQRDGYTNITLGQQVGTEQTKITSENLPANSLSVKITGLNVKTTGASVKIPVNDDDGEGIGLLPSEGVLGKRDDGLYATSGSGKFYSGKPISVDLGTMSIDGTAKVDVTGKSDQPFSNMQPSLGLNYIICLEGIYPPRP